MIHRLRPRGRRDEGASAVEFALVLPILLLLVFGIISYGTLFAQQLALNNGVRQGARIAVVEGSLASDKTCAGAVSAVRNSTGPAIAMNTADINVKVTRSASTPCGTAVNPSSGTVVCTNSINAATGAQQSVIVEATYPAELILPLPVPGLQDSFTLTSKAVYKCEFS
jgi:Flp pilus assembly protein TadG